MIGVHASAPRPVLLARALAAVALLLGAGALLAGPASAHVSLTGTVPTADEQVATAPTEVQLTYSDALLAVGNAVSVTGPSGALTLEPLQVADRTLVQPLPADLPPGAYTVSWRAASGDGHPIEGSFSFTSTAPVPTSTTTEPSTTTSTSATTTSAASEEPSTTASRGRPDGCGGPAGVGGRPGRPARRRRGRGGGAAPSWRRAGSARVSRWTAVQPWVSTLLRLVLAGVFAVAGALKLPDPDESVRAVRAYRLLPESVVPFVGYGLPVFEVLLALALLVGVLTRASAVVVGRPAGGVRGRRRLGGRPRPVHRLRLLRRRRRGGRGADEVHRGDRP